jgi:hypothetical protein
MRTLLAGVLVFLLVAPAQAEVDVQPKRKSSSVILKGTDKTRPSARPGRTRTQPRTPAAPITNPIYPPNNACKVDPVAGTYGCEDVEPADPEEGEGPEVTPGDVLRAVREIGLPSLQVQVQPGEKTLVNVRTIFYAQPQPFERSVDLLGFDVDLAAEPVSYEWVHGDGSTSTTTQPGRPYPAMDVTHRYTSPADGLRAQVNVTYRVRFRVDGGPWSTLAQTLVASGPAATLDVKEAVPVLAKP